jgi:hypothetical protein
VHIEPDTSEYLSGEIHVLLEPDYRRVSWRAEFARDFWTAVGPDPFFNALYTAYR